MSKKLIFKCLETGEVGDYRYWAEKHHTKTWVKKHCTVVDTISVNSYKRTDETKARMSKSAKIRCSTDEYKQMRKLIENDEWKNKIRESVKKSVTPAKKDKISKAVKLAYAEGRKDMSFMQKDEYKQLHSKIAKNVLQSPDVLLKNKLAHQNEDYRKKRSELTCNLIKLGKMKACYIYDNLTFDSSWELYFYLFCKIGGNTIERNVCYDLPNDKHTFIDFKVNGKLYEIKGPQFFNENGNLFNCYNNELYAEKQKFYEDFNVTIITDIEPYAKVVDSYYNKGYVAMFNTKLDFPYDDPIYKCHCRNKKSPYEAFYDFTLRQKAVDNRLCYGRVSRYEGDPNKPLEARDIITAFNVTKMAPKVSELSTTRIKTILDSYEIKTLVNPFAGFGNTSIYCKQKGINYKGYDINNIRSIEGIEIADVTKIVDENYYDVLFACPPYSDKESWLVEMPEIKTCDDWIDVCLHNFPNCKQYVFIVDETKHPYTLLSNKNHLSKKSAEKLVKIN